MTLASESIPLARRAAPAALRPGAGQPPLYPLAWPLFIAGLVAGAIAFAIFQSLAVGTGVALLFAICGFTWRRDMPPVIPFCLTFQWISAYVGVMYFISYGSFPGGGDTKHIENMLWAVQLGFIFLTLGLRAGMRLFSSTYRRALGNWTHDYNLNRLTQLTIILFVSDFFFDILPKAIWFGGSQIIENLMSVRFIPYFVLLLIVFRRGKGYGYLVLSTAVILLPQLLTGFSNFKEILFVILLAALFQWRPWVRTRTQRARNLKIISGGILAILTILLFGLIWSGGVKDQWRDEIWHTKSAGQLPIQRMGQFMEIVGKVSSDLDLEASANTLAARLSSGSLYFSYVLNRVPEIVRHENGNLIGRAIKNALVPRFLFPEKSNLHGDSWLVRQYAGVQAAGDESGASIGLGYMPEFYIDFGYSGIAILCFLYGFLLTACLAIFAKVSPTGPIFIALSIGLLINYFLVFDASFAKILGGMIQRTGITSLAMMLLAPTVLRWVTRGGPAPPRIYQRSTAAARRMLAAPRQDV